MLCFIKHQAPRNRRTASQTLICLQLINCPASRLTLPPRLSTRGRETGSSRRERAPVCDCEELSHHIRDYCIPWGDAKHSPCPSLPLRFWWMQIRMGGSGCLFDFQSDAPALALSGRLMDTDVLPTPKHLRARLSGASQLQTPLLNTSAASSELPCHAFEQGKTPLRQQHCYVVVVVGFTLQTGKGPSCPCLPEHVAATHKCQPQQQERSCSCKSTNNV